MNSFPTDQASAVYLPLRTAWWSARRRPGFICRLYQFHWSLRQGSPNTISQLAPKVGCCGVVPEILRNLHLEGRDFLTEGANYCGSTKRPGPGTYPPFSTLQRPTSTPDMDRSTQAGPNPEHLHSFNYNSKWLTGDWYLPVNDTEYIRLA